MSGVLGDDFQRFIANNGEDPSPVRSLEGATILANLSFRDLKRLRASVKQVYMRYYPVEFFTDREADKMIESLSPRVVERLIKAEVDRKIFGRDGRLNDGHLDLMGLSDG